MRLARQAGQITAGVPGLVARLCRLRPGQRADRGRGPGRRRARLRGGPGPGPRRGRPVEPGGPAALMVILDLEAGRLQDAAAHLREALQLDTRTGHLVCAGQRPGLLRAAVRRDRALRRGRHGVGRARRAQAAARASGPARGVRRREGPLRRARQALGPARARAAEKRGAAMSLATAAEYALMLTDPGPPQPAHRARGRSAPGNGSWSPWSPRAAPTRRSPRSCTSASAPSAPTWTGSGTRPAAAAAPT